MNHKTNHKTNLILHFIVAAFLSFSLSSCKSPDNKVPEVTSYTGSEKTMNPDECVSRAMSVQEEARQAIIAKEGPKDFKFHSAKHTDSCALAIDGGIIRRTYGPSGFVQMVFNSGKRKCAVTVETKNVVKVLSDNITCQ